MLWIFIAACLFVGFNIFISGLFTAFSNGTVSGGLWMAWPITEGIILAVSLLILIIYRKKYAYYS